MNVMESLKIVEQALEFAFVAHEGQLDKSGMPFVLHPISVAAHIERLGFPHHMIIAALLHDIIEDTTNTEDDLLNAGFCPRTVALVKILTRTHGEVYADYINRVAHSPEAIFIKLADLEHNSREDRSASIPATLIQRYNKARYKLQEALMTHDADVRRPCPAKDSCEFLRCNSSDCLIE
jgi:(p)ppGpp synthase/HD superfamily hydrolase